MKPDISHIQEKLEKRKLENAFRELKINEGLIDFCSNDYLGFSTEKTIHASENIEQYGATGSRLISGNHQITEEVEVFLSKYYKAESGLIFSSGYTANIGLFSCIAERSDTIIYDELIHASIRDGIKLSNANSFSFRHNDLSSLENKIQKAKGSVFVAVESIYSMDGDEAPLIALVGICKKHNADLIVDEAHAVGVFGLKGEGLIVKYQLEKDVFARVVTFGKAFGAHGAVVLGDKLLRDYLINYSRAFIYTTALPLSTVLVIKKAHQFLVENLDRIEKLHQLIAYFKSSTLNHQLSINNSKSAIQSVVIPGNGAVKQLAESIQSKGFDVRPILSPTVPKGEERLRICLHSFNTKEEIATLITLLAKTTPIEELKLKSTKEDLGFRGGINKSVTHLYPPSREATSPLEGRLSGVITESNNYYNKNLKAFARENRKEMTREEVKIWNELLRKKQCFGYKFLRQQPILNYIVDFMCPELKLIVEIDGYPHHFEEIYKNDEKRQNEIEKLGYTFVRFDDDEVMNDFNNVIRTFDLIINKN